MKSFLSTAVAAALLFLVAPNASAIIESYSWATQPWSDCSVTCGGGIQTRDVVCEDDIGGGVVDDSKCTADKPDTEQPCNLDPCPVDCVVSSWSPWSSCSEACGGGVQVRTRSVTQEAMYEGTACPPLEEQKSCNTNPCPVDCEVSDWSPWTECSEACGGGVRARTRGVTQPAMYGGETCPDLGEEAACNLQPCPVDCEWTSWSPWLQCSTGCGGGTQGRARSIAQPAMYGGNECAGPSIEDRACNEQPCPVPCEVSDWSPWTSCSEECGGGTRLRSRTVTKDPQHGGGCYPLEESEACNTDPCPVDCQVSDWSPWTECSEECGGGSHSHTRTVTQEAMYGGTACPGLSEMLPCNDHACPVDCEVSEWSPWTTCTEECGGGTRLRTRTVTHEAMYGGGCVPLEENGECNTDPCPVDCEVSDWSEWSECSEECGGGNKTHTRTVTQPAVGGGEVCPALEEDAVCNDHVCPCGNGSLDEGETCDWDVEAGNEGHDADCRSDCTYCGDEVIDSVEECDDGNDVEGDGCSAACAIEDGWDCGDDGCEVVADDGIVEGDEACDDGNVDDDDGCYEGVVEEGWTCDEAEPSECVEDALPSECGDGVLDEGETCDDANEDDDDGCSADCLTEDGYRCDGAGEDSCEEQVNDAEGESDAGGEGVDDVGSADIGLDAGDGSADVRSGESGDDAEEGCTVADGTSGRSAWWIVGLAVCVLWRRRR